MNLINTVFILCSTTSPVVFSARREETSMLVESNNSDQPNRYNRMLNPSDSSEIVYKKSFDYLDIEGKAHSVMNKIIEFINITVANNDEKLFVEYVDDNKNKESFLRSISLLFSDDSRINEQMYFINILLASDIEIFEYWYKLALVLGSNSNSLLLSNRSKDILDYYKEDFSFIDLSNVFN